MTRMVVTGKESKYISKEIGSVYYEKVELKGSPVEWVKQASTKMTEDQIRLLLGRLANEESTRFGFVAGRKMGRKAFWRNALAYFNNRVKK